VIGNRLSVRRNQAWAALLPLIALSCALLPGRAAARPDDAQPVIRSVDVTLTPEKKFVVGKETVTLAKLPDALKKAGADKTTQIVVAIEAGTTQETLKAIAGKLRAAGYARMLFTKPRHADAHVGAEPPPPGDEKRTPSRGTPR
jgi:biopolymer transport protein ExbD